MQDAVRSNYPEICSLLIENGAKICEGGNLVPLTESALNGIVAMRPVAGAEFGIEAEWEIHAGDLQIINKLGEGEFGEVFKVLHLAIAFTPSPPHSSHAPALILLPLHATCLIPCHYPMQHLPKLTLRCTTAHVKLWHTGADISSFPKPPNVKFHALGSFLSLCTADLVRCDLRVPVLYAQHWGDCAAQSGRHQKPCTIARLISASPACEHPALRGRWSPPGAARVPCRSVLSAPQRAGALQWHVRRGEAAEELGPDRAWGLPHGDVYAAAVAPPERRAVPRRLHPRSAVPHCHRAHELLPQHSLHPHLLPHAAATGAQLWPPQQRQSAAPPCSVPPMPVAVHDPRIQCS